MKVEEVIFAGASPGKAVSVQPIRGVERLNRITIGRREPVEEGLIKEGIKCAAYFAAPGGRARAKKLPEVLRYGYVFLAEAEAQVGLDLAGQNQLLTDRICQGQPDHGSRVHRRSGTRASAR